MYDERFLLHDTGPYHPEHPERLKAILKGIQDAGLLSDLTVFPAVSPEMKWIEAVHTKEYIQRFKEKCLAGEPILDDPDNKMCKDTYNTALLAVGGVIDAVRRVMENELDNAFCAVRPPGHHAEADKAMGFCYFGNVAIAAKYLLQKWHLSQILIIDFDAHHGNGTQHIFESDPSVIYYSIHQHPSFAYPGTGREFEVGTGKGTGSVKNSTSLPGNSDDDWKHLVERDLLPIFDKFNPEFILVSTGFDAHIDDQMSNVKISTEWYTWMIKLIMELASKHTDGKLVSVLEGGYVLKRLPELAKNHVEVLLNHSCHRRKKCLSQKQ